jgi:tRNA 2-selenouridine synthase SelU
MPLYERSGLMAPRPPNIKLENQQDEAINADGFSSDTHGEAGRHNGTGEDQTLNEPLLFHKVKNQKSILAIVISESKIFAGTQGGGILVRLWAGWTFD